MDSSRKILIITYYWPPSGGVGVQRWMNFALQLKNRGWEPWVLTPENPQFEIKDEKLLEKVKDIPVVKIPIWEPFNLFHKLTRNKDRKNVQQGLVLEKSKRSFKDNLMIWVRGNLLIPDPRVFWVKPAAKRAIELIEKEGIDTIITTGPPHSMHLIGKRVKKKTGVKWLADFRDPWSKWDVLEKLKTSSIALDVHQRLERSVLKNADCAMTVSSRLADALGGIEVIHNGITVRNKSDINPNSAHFTIGYFGLLNELRNPRQLWQLLDQMCRESQVFANKLRIRIGGIVSESIKDEICELKELNGKVEFLDYLPHETMQDEYRKCDILLLLLNKSTNSEWILPVKFFEYLAAERMILGMGERKSDLGDLMNTKDVGEILAYSEIDSIRGFIEDIFENERRPNGEDTASLLNQFSHERLVDKLEELIKR
ncbi:glycosyltransferase family 4 protein [Ekhidna sp.]|uniref:glycosyltransferase family 4 protein n=1 Tax=Ekhidna sp. TaxID=2608089 RepID=UPI003B59DB58